MDIDDNDPYFPLYPRVTTLEVEEEKINAYVGRVNISDDKDFLPENRIMCYYLYGNWPQRWHLFKFALKSLERIF